jgi:hydrogenase-4 membrane subunit HyfE
MDSHQHHPHGIGFGTGRVCTAHYGLVDFPGSDRIIVRKSAVLQAAAVSQHQSVERLSRRSTEASMSLDLATRLIDFIGAFLLITMIVILAAGQLYRAIYAVAAQSVFISFAGAVLGSATHNVDLWIIAVVTLAVKAVALPWLLLWVIRRMKIRREIQPLIPVTVTLAIAAAIVLLAFYLSSSLGPVKQAITGNALPIGISLMLMGILVMMSRRKALTQMVGLFASENGIFFTAMAVSQGMPLIIEIGVTLDVILGALVMGVMVIRVRSSINSDIADMERLRG